MSLKHFTWEPNPRFQVRKLVGWEMTSSGSFSANVWEVSIRCVGPTSASEGKLPTSWSVLKEIRGAVDRAMIELTEAGANLILEAMGKDSVIAWQVLKGRLQAMQGVERFEDDFQACFELLKANGVVERDWETSGATWPTLTVRKTSI